MNKQTKVFLSGVASIFVLMPSTTYSQIPEIQIDNKSDFEKLHSDWIKIGNDIQKSIETYGKE
jgi:hypothetical protein